MSVRQHDWLSYFVDSRTDAEQEYFVEIDAYGGNGACDCKHFVFRLEPKLRDEGHLPSDATRCHHIVEAREYFTDKLIELIKKRKEETGVAKKERWYA